MKFRCYDAWTSQEFIIEAKSKEEAIKKFKRRFKRQPDEITKEG